MLGFTVLVWAGPWAVGGGRKCGVLLDCDRESGDAERFYVQVVRGLGVGVGVGAECDCVGGYVDQCSEVTGVSEARKDACGVLALGEGELALFDDREGRKTDLMLKLGGDPACFSDKKGSTLRCSVFFLQKRRGKVVEYL